MEKHENITKEKKADGTQDCEVVNTVTFTLDRVVAESLLRCLKYYELDNLSTNDELQIIESLEQGCKVENRQAAGLDELAYLKKLCARAADVIDVRCKTRSTRLSEFIDELRKVSES
jgi:hypothetical protein